MEQNVIMTIGDYDFFLRRCNAQVVLLVIINGLIDHISTTRYVTWWKIQPCLVSSYLSMFILFVLEDPLCSNDIIMLFGSLHNSPYLVAGEVVEFFMHGIYPIRIVKCIFNLKGLNTRDKQVMLTKVCQTSTSSYPLFYASIDVFGEMLKML